MSRQWGDPWLGSLWLVRSRGSCVTVALTPIDTFWLVGEDKARHFRALFGIQCQSHSRTHCATVVPSTPMTHLSRALCSLHWSLILSSSPFCVVSLVNALYSTLHAAALWSALPCCALALLAAVLDSPQLWTDDWLCCSPQLLCARQRRSSTVRRTRARDDFYSTDVGKTRRTDILAPPRHATTQQRSRPAATTAGRFQDASTCSFARCREIITKQIQYQFLHEKKLDCCGKCPKTTTVRNLSSDWSSIISASSTSAIRILICQLSACWHTCQHAHKHLRQQRTSKTHKTNTAFSHTHHLPDALYHFASRTSRRRFYTHTHMHTQERVHTETLTDKQVHRNRGRPT